MNADSDTNLIFSFFTHFGYKLSENVNLIAKRVYFWIVIFLLILKTILIIRAICQFLLLRRHCDLLNENIERMVKKRAEELKEEIKNEERKKRNKERKREKTKGTDGNIHDSIDTVPEDSPSPSDI